MHKKSLLLCSFALASIYAFANSQSSKHSEDNSITVHIPSATEEGKLRTLKLLNLPTTPELEKQYKKAFDGLSKARENDYSNGITTFESSAAKDIGMNGTPVLDQGQHNTCATFGTTGFLDAELEKGDYIDQQCLLAVSQSVGQNFWNGSWPENIYSLLKDYGIVSKNNCFGVAYPSEYQYVSVSQYTQISHRNDLSYKYLQTTSLSTETIKREIDTGHRALLVVDLVANDNDPISVNGFNIMVDGEKKKGGGLWACSQPESYSNYCIYSSSGRHALTIIGYDDNQRLLKIRNSWGEAYGDGGDYYMTYEFFRAMGRKLYVLTGY